MKCACGQHAQIHLTDKDKGIKKNWCLDCAPPEYEEDVAEMRIHREWQETWEEMMKPGRPTPRPSWRVAASSAFSTAWRAAKKRYSK